MINLPNPNEFYRSLLKLGHLVVSPEGLVSEELVDKSTMPFFVSNCRMVIPEPQQLKVTPGEERIFFQAGRENIMLGETKEFAAFRKKVNEVFQIKIMAVVSELMVLAFSPALHVKLSGNQLDLLRGLENVDKSTFTALKGLFEAGENDATKHVFSLYLNKNGKLGTDNKAYRRMAVVSFPLYEQLIADGANRDTIMNRRKEQPKDQRDDLPDNETFGVKLGKHNRATIARVFEYIFPVITNKHAYSSGSNSDFFPYLEAFCKSVQSVGEALNAVIDQFVDLIPTLEYHRVDLSWVPIIASPEGLYQAAMRVPDQNQGGAVGGPTQQPGTMHPGAIPIAPEIPVLTNPHNVAPNQVGLPQNMVQQPVPQVQGVQQPVAQPRGEQGGNQAKTLQAIFGAPQMPQQQPGMMPMGMMPMQPGMMQPQQGMFFAPPQVRPGVYMGGGMPGMAQSTFTGQPQQPVMMQNGMMVMPQQGMAMQPQMGMQPQQPMMYPMMNTGKPNI